VGTCEDITERKIALAEIRRLNDELELRIMERTAEWQAANKELEAFSYSVAHDLRAPLRAIVGFSAILTEEYAAKLPEQAQHYLEVVANNASQMGKLIDGLLAFSRLERQTLRKERIAPADVARAAWEELEEERRGRDVEIDIGTLPCCLGDRLLLKQVFVNLFSNALKFTRGREGARIEIGATTLAQMIEPQTGARRTDGADCAVYYVRDNGAGFDMRHVGKLFRVFQRLHSAEEFEGTGVGLANVQRIVQRHGGRVWAEGAPDLGATFYFTLAEAVVPRVGRAAGLEVRTLCKTN
jgi:light-regulated signal transduction histidine kinase (bacteriophytochrome)